MFGASVALNFAIFPLDISCTKTYLSVSLLESYYGGQLSFVVKQILQHNEIL